MCHEYATAHWDRLFPDAFGSYVDGGWGRTSDMPNISFDAGAGGACTGCPYAPLFFASAVLPDGRVVVVGGEYLFNTVRQAIEVWSNLGFIYDPTADSWNGPLTGGFGSGSVGDAMCEILQNGKFILQNIDGKSIESLDAVALSFSELMPTGKVDINDEENWNIVPSGKVLTVDSRTSSASEIYDPATNSWSDAGSTPVNLADTDTVGLDGGARNPTNEPGTGVLRPDGTLAFFSANIAGRNAVYDTRTGSWSNPANSNFPSGYSVQDGPAALLPSGNVLVMASPARSLGEPSPGMSHFYELSLANVLSAVTGAGGGVNDANGAASTTAFNARMIVLPTGEVLLTGVQDNESALQVQTYSEVDGGSPQSSWKPVVTSTMSPQQIAPGGKSYPIFGQRFNGLSEGASYGNDAQSSTNYPLIRITNNATGHVFYLRTRNHSSMGVQSAGSDAGVSTTFDAPPGLELGASTLAVVANGVASDPLPVMVTNNPVPALGGHRNAGLLMLGLGAAGMLLISRKRANTEE
jgi:hypothetical protein